MEFVPCLTLDFAQMLKFYLLLIMKFPRDCTLLGLTRNLYSSQSREVEVTTFETGEKLHQGWSGFRSATEESLSNKKCIPRRSFTWLILVHLDL